MRLSRGIPQRFGSSEGDRDGASLAVETTGCLESFSRANRPVIAPDREQTLRGVSVDPAHRP